MYVKKRPILFQEKIGSGFIRFVLCSTFILPHSAGKSNSFLDISAIFNDCGSKSGHNC